MAFENDFQFPFVSHLRLEKKLHTLSQTFIMHALPHPAKNMLGLLPPSKPPRDKKLTLSSF